jgi:hypothetical protein
MGSYWYILRLYGASGGPTPCLSGPHCIRWPYAPLFDPMPGCVVEPVSMSWNRLAVIEFIGVLNIVADSWHNCYGGGGW